MNRTEREIHLGDCQDFQDFHVMSMFDKNQETTFALLHFPLSLYNHICLMQKQTKNKVVKETELFHWFRLDN